MPERITAKLLCRSPLRVLYPITTRILQKTIRGAECKYCQRIWPMVFYWNMKIEPALKKLLTTDHLSFKVVNE